jgi:hypothetical protein
MRFKNLENPNRYLWVSPCMVGRPHCWLLIFNLNFIKGSRLTRLRFSVQFHLLIPAQEISRHEVCKHSQCDILINNCFIRIALCWSIMRTTWFRGKVKTFIICSFFSLLNSFKFDIILVIIGFVGQRKKLFSRDNVSRLAVPNIVQLTCNFSTDLTKEDLAIAIKIATQYIILMELLIVHLNTRKLVEMF